MKHLQAITLIKPCDRFYSSTLEAAGCQPSVFSGGLECALLPVKLCMCVFVCVFVLGLRSIRFQ